jgi:hypothetical protein
MGCLLALFAGIFPRLALLILWVARPARIDIGHWGAGGSQRRAMAR